MRRRNTTEGRSSLTLTRYLPGPGLLLRRAYARAPHQQARHPPKRNRQAGPLRLGRALRRVSGLEARVEVKPRRARHLLVETVIAPGPRRSGGSPAASAPRGPAPG